MCVDCDKSEDVVCNDCELYKKCSHCKLDSECQFK